MFNVRCSDPGAQHPASHISRLTPHNLPGLAALVGLLIGALPVCAGPLGAGEFVIATNARFPDVAYNSTDGTYLVVYMQYPAPAQICGRFVTADGAVSGDAITISTGVTTYTLFPSIAYNATDNEFLVTWDDERGGDTTWGQRVRGSDGALLGPNFQISPGHGVRSAAAWNAAHNVYLVAYWTVSTSEVRHRRVSNTGALLGSEVNVSNDTAFSGYPAVASDNGNQFLVTWDYEVVENVLSIRGRRVDASTGAALGNQIVVSDSGREGRSCIAFDPGSSRWLVQFNQSNPGQSFDQYGQFVSVTGSLVGGNFPIAATQNFEGDTQFGGDIAFAPQPAAPAGGPGRYFSSFATQAGMGGIESLPSGAPVTPQTVVLGTGLAYFSLNNAADTNLDRFLTVWEGDTVDPPVVFRIRGRVYAATDLIPPDPVQAFTAQPGSRAVRLNWTNPATPDFAGTMIRVKPGSYPTGPGDGQLLIDKAAAPGSTDAYLHSGLASGTTYYYAAFAHDARPNHAAGVTASAVAGIRGDFEPDGDVDLSDFAMLQRCLSGDAAGYGEGCAETDLDGDADVDGSDFGLFLPCLAGPDLPPPPGC